MISISYLPFWFLYFFPFVTHRLTTFRQALPKLGVGVGCDAKLYHHLRQLCLLFSQIISKAMYVIPKSWSITFTGVEELNHQYTNKGASEAICPTLRTKEPIPSMHINHKEVKTMK